MIDQPLVPLGDPARFQLVKRAMSDLGAFPSDNAALIAIAIVVAFMVSARTGFLVTAFALYASLLRVAYGYHWPSDVTGGAVLGAGVMLVLFHCRRSYQGSLDRILALVDLRPALTATIGTVLIVEFCEGFRYSQLVTSLLLNVRLFH
jgi:hypothetical protein